MPLKVNVGLSKKVGQRDYGSLGATCNVEFEADAGLLQTDLEAFHRRVRDAYGAAARAVHDELARQQSQAARKEVAHPVAPPGGNGSNSHATGGRGPSEKQLVYLRQLAGQTRGLGFSQLDRLAQRMCGKPVAGLSSHDVSQLIDALKAAKAGELDLAVLEEVTL